MKAGANFGTGGGREASAERQAIEGALPKAELSQEGIAEIVIIAARWEASAREFRRSGNDGKPVDNPDGQAIADKYRYQASLLGSVLDTVAPLEDSKWRQHIDRLATEIDQENQSSASE